MISDEILACQVLRGEVQAFEELVNRYKNQVFAVIYRIVGHQEESEDLTQEVFLTVYEKLYQFDSSKKFSPWIYRIATNTSISALRKKKKVVLLNFDESYTPYENDVQLSADPQFIFEQKELQQYINAAIKELPENYRIIITLRYQLDLSNQEIADILGISKENVEVKVHRARKALRKVFARHQVERGYENGLSANR